MRLTCNFLWPCAQSGFRKTKQLFEAGAIDGLDIHVLRDGCDELRQIAGVCSLRYN